VGKERIDCKSAAAGDIVAAVKLRETPPETRSPTDASG